MYALPRHRHKRSIVKQDTAEGEFEERGADLRVVLAEGKTWRRRISEAGKTRHGGGEGKK